jgi:hypothetical protein
MPEDEESASSLGLLVALVVLFVLAQVLHACAPAVRVRVRTGTSKPLVHVIVDPAPCTSELDAGAPVVEHL